MRPGSREWGDAQSPGGAKLVRCGAIRLGLTGKVADAGAQGVAQTVMQSCWLAPPSGQSPGVAQLARLAIGPQGDIANAAAG